MNNTYEYLDYLKLYNLRRLGLSILSCRISKSVPSAKVARDIAKAKKENNEADRYIKNFLEESEDLRFADIAF